jgi:hydroxyethylthiazole kinase-like uncharacterized protein yjeF
MKRVFKEVDSLDQKCYTRYQLSEDILMEHAALGLKRAIPQDTSSILIVCGPGNNGADGITLSRLLHKKMDVKLYIPIGAKSKMAKIQLERAKSIGVDIVDDILSTDVIVDAIFGSGLNKELPSKIVKLIGRLNSLESYKIACDIPTGMIFQADTTVTMGAVKESLLEDSAKDFIGDLVVADLGIDSKLYEDDSSVYLLQEKDLKLPLRGGKNRHKGDYGHLAVVAGKKFGAAIISARSGFAFGSGLVTIVENENYPIPYEIMSSSTLPKNTTAICIGMGLGNIYDRDTLARFLSCEVALLIDADLFYNPILVELLDKKDNLVLTPHPKEFCALLKLTGIADITVQKLQQKRFYYIREFCNRYRDIVLVLKGSNTLISQDNTIYVQSLGSVALSKGGSGDVLAGLIGSLLAQGYTPLESAIQGSLAHALTLKKFTKNNYALTPEDIIEGVKSL